ncbi:ribose ABC transporter, periplasmic binding protein [[Actinomadura] parvosata subsp. kistnae]|uniref:Sugar ABC transporter substrate-binding protein n=1 Tax=[Actinomadura] parvosata subsp. kistnae TaxID=1909395 RepID=A0A1U9ZRE0_9ACTN|nr:ABC transporter substrate-binding protein [Nonomuraea sp. ATCC 55076]AQZ60517.1 sugar ABC transporter substrate-binding protein [Nonomuraea sp. ATCC 55076]SPL90927.1 ribose ABC transporter, periplasmic binding protein [Actinomadura parvosata subsp. kistnae]
MRKAMAALAAMLLITSCGGGGEGSGGGGDRIRVALVQGLAGEEFYETMACGARAKAKELGVDLDVQGPQKFDPTLQTPIVNSVVAGAPDAMLIAPTDVKAMIAPLTQAKQQNIKIILVDTVVEDPTIGLSRISTDNLKGGAAAAEALSEQVGGKGKVLVISTDPGVSTVDARIKGFEDEIKASHPGLTYVGVQYSHNDVGEASRIMNAALAKDADLAGVFATNLNSATGAGTALQQAGKLGKVKMVGFDAGPAQVKQLKDGVVQALIAQLPADIGAKGVEQAVAAVKGQEVTPSIPTDATIVTAANVDRPEVQKVLYKAGC